MYTDVFSFDVSEKEPDRVIERDVLIIGAGAAGARAGIELKENNVDCLVIGKRGHGDAHTVWAAGGINASLVNRDLEDSWEIHAADTMDEGHHINTPKSVELVTKTMPNRIQELNDWGCDFDLHNGKIDQRYFGAQSFRRTCYVGDKTGRAILETLVDKAQEVGVPYEDNIMITKLLSDDSRVYGAVGFDMENGDLLLFKSNRVILAAGGYSAVYHRHSSRDLENNGDGVSLAYDAGAKLENIEFVQFHPTGMMVSEKYDDWNGRLITEAVRGEGGRLFNSKGERFMKKYSPDQMELDARDVVARAIDTEINEGRGTENGGVYLDISHRSENFIKEKLPRMYERCQNVGIDLSQEPIEVAPTAHYSMGGVKIDPETGESTIENLHAIGETTSGVHGANRLGGNSLAETVALGKIVGEHLSEQEYNTTETPKSVEQKGHKHLGLLSTLSQSQTGNITTTELVNRIRTVAEESTGIIRNEEDLKKGRETLLENVQPLFNNISSKNDLTSESFEELIDAVFMYYTTHNIISGAMSRKESRGAHYRSDYPNKDSNLQKKTTYQLLRERNTLKHSLTFSEPPTKLNPKIQDALDQNYELDYHHLE